MPGTRSTAALALLAGTLIALAAGCGGGSDSSGGAGTQAAAGSNPASFGQQAGATERAAATAAVRDFLRAWVGNDPAKACSLMAASTKQNLATFSSQLNSGDCQDEAKTVRSAMQPKLLARLRGIQVTSVRLDGGRGFVLYRAQGQSWALPVLREGSAWKVAAIVGYPTG
jgi:hypothetical protein